MGFLQGPITNIHRFDSSESLPPVDSLAVVIPVAADTLERPAAKTVFQAVAGVEPDSVIIPARGSPSALRELTDLADSYVDRAEVLWCNSPEVKRLCSRYDIPQQGKGSDVWLALGPAADRADVIACVDADVTSATEAQLRRLVAPIGDTISATKAWYTRIEQDTFYGRLCRLLVRPLILALEEQYDDPYLSYLRAFRYPLSGEIAIHSSFVHDLQVPAGMGLEVGVLGELFGLVGPDHIAQVELGNHRHSHRPIHGDGGLTTIASQITGALLDTLSAQATITPDSALVDEYTTWAKRTVEQHARDASVNGLSYDVDAEFEQVEHYRHAVSEPAAVSWVPAWSETSLDAELVLEAGTPPGVSQTGP